MPSTSIHSPVNEALAQIYKDAIQGANASWTETDKLYVTVCSALIGFGSLFGQAGTGLRDAGLIVGMLVCLLSLNWLCLIGRYRLKILSALQGLASVYANTEIDPYYRGEEQQFRRGKYDYLTAIPLLIASLLLIGYSATHR